MHRLLNFFYHTRAYSQALAPELLSESGGSFPMISHMNKWNMQAKLRKWHRKVIAAMKSDIDVFYLFAGPR